MPEQIAACINLGDVFVRGEGGEIFPEIARRIGDRGRACLSEVEWAALRSLIVCTDDRLSRGCRDRCSFCAAPFLGAVQ